MPPARRSDSKNPKKTSRDAQASGLPPVATDLPFEQAIEELEGVVENLEDGELDLEAALVAFEQGVALSKHCAGQLESAERRIEVLVEQGGELLATPFDGDDAENAGDE